MEAWCGVTPHASPYSSTYRIQTHTARGRAGWERGRVKECLLEMRVGRPVIIYRIMYDDGAEV